MTIAPADSGLGAPLAMIAPWMAAQRWYTNKGSRPLLTEIGSFRLAAPAGIDLVTHLLMDHAAHTPVLYQVPLAYRTQLADGMLIGKVGNRYVYDAPHDADYTRALLAFLGNGLQSMGHLMSAAGRPSTRGPASRELRATVVRGEQSNTSIVFTSADGSESDVIVKLFRTLHDGVNPDVELQTVLAAAGSRAVPLPFGHIVADWNDTRLPHGRARGHLAFAQEYLRNSLDGWQLALAAARAGEDFTERALELGATTAGVHATLAAALPTIEMTDRNIAAVIDHMRGRLRAAVVEVPSLARYEERLQHALSRTATASWPPQQRIHGDLHLGQVLASPGRGWVIIDFEGEPLRPMTERSGLDSALRDVAGMLRSFDYVAGTLSAAGASADAVAWSQAARTAFSAGYSAASGRDLAENSVLVDAFEIDKALYETVYEVRNRPSWLPIPLAALDRLATRFAG